jgi:multidrug efflux system membrane fusion protein
VTEHNTQYSEPATPGSSTPQAESSKKSLWWLWLIAAIVLVAALTIWQRRGAASQAKTTGDPAARAITISAAVAKQGDIGIFLDALGTVTPVYTVTVTGRVQGEITQVYYREGQMVRKGDPLLEIDPRPYQAAVTQMEGQLAHDQAVLTEAKIDLERYQQAYSRNAIAKQQLDDQQQVVLQDEGTVKNDEGQLANARVNLIYTHITSPIDGRVGLRLVDPGNIVQANSSTPLVVITQLQPITVIFSIAEDHLAQIQEQLRKGKKLTVDAYDREQTKKIASGTLLTLDNVIDTTTGTLKLKAVFPNEDNALFPNQFVNARLLVDELHNAVLVPTQAIQRNAQGAFVYAVKSDQTVEIRSVTPGTTDGMVTAVAGLQPGETVAVNGFDKLLEGAKVNVRQPSNPSGPGQSAKSGQSAQDQAGNRGSQTPASKGGGVTR